MDIAKYAGQKIKYFREQKRWTQTDLAKKVGIGKTAVANYESGLRSPKQDILFDLAKVFDISINEFFPETVVKENNIASMAFTNYFHNIKTSSAIITCHFADELLSF